MTFKEYYLTESEIKGTEFQKNIQNELIKMGWIYVKNWEYGHGPYKNESQFYEYRTKSMNIHIFSDTWLLKRRNKTWQWGKDIGKLKDSIESLKRYNLELKGKK